MYLSSRDEVVHLQAYAKNLENEIVVVTANTNLVVPQCAVDSWGARGVPLLTMHGISASHAVRVGSDERGRLPKDHVALDATAVPRIPGCVPRSDQRGLCPVADEVRSGIFRRDLWPRGRHIFWSYLLFEIPSNVLLERIGARLTLLRIMVLWG